MVQILDRLHTLISEDDGEALDCFQASRASLMAAAPSEVWFLFETALEEYDFGVALTELKRIRHNLTTPTEGTPS